MSELVKELSAIAALHRGKVHGDIRKEDSTEVDIEFPDTRYAMTFRDEMSLYPSVTCELRKGDTITDLTRPVVLTVDVLNVW